MKKIILSIAIALTGVLFSTTVNAQKMRITAYQGSAPATSFIIVGKPDFNFAAPLNEVGFTVQIPKIVGGNPIAMPTLSVKNNFLATTFGTWQQVSESASDPAYYNYKIGATALTGAPVLTVNNGTELQIVELEVSLPAGVTSLAPLVRVAHLADGGPGSQYGVAVIDGSASPVDLTNYVQIFYGAGAFPLVPAADETAGYGTYQFITPIVVPVKFVGFSAVKRSKNAFLTWSIENESPITDRYEIERSFNGTDFTLLTIVQPKNNGRSANTYDLTDYNLAASRSSTSPYFYYRVKQVDKDGKFVYTETRSVRLDDKGIAVYPNPVKDFANVSFDLANDAEVILTVCDVAGKEVRNMRIQGIKGTNMEQVNMVSLASGTYTLKVQAGTDTQTISLVKGK